MPRVKIWKTSLMEFAISGRIAREGWVKRWVKRWVPNRKAEQASNTGEWQAWNKLHADDKWDSNVGGIASAPVAETSDCFGQWMCVKSPKRLPRKSNPIAFLAFFRQLVALPGTEKRTLSGKQNILSNSYVNQWSWRRWPMTTDWQAKNSSYSATYKEPYNNRVKLKSF